MGGILSAFIPPQIQYHKRKIRPTISPSLKITRLKFVRAMSERNRKCFKPQKCVYPQNILVLNDLAVRKSGRNIWSVSLNVRKRPRGAHRKYYRHCSHNDCSSGDKFLWRQNSRNRISTLTEPSKNSKCE
jgi:hypothetical protein